MNSEKMQKDVHAVAVRNGWWEKKRPIGELVALAHSELSEMLEGYRAGNHDNVEEELADVMIRVLDMKEGLRQEKVIVRDCSVESPVPEAIASLHACLTEMLYECGNKKTVIYYINEIIRLSKLFASIHSIDLDAQIKRKHEINKQRSYRHGNKRC